MKIPMVFGLAIMAGFSAICGYAQSSEGSWQIGFEGQVYPAGVIPGLRISHDLAERTELNFRIAMNIADRGDNGEHDQEEGEGPGFSFGARRFLADNHEKWFVGLRADVWFLEIDWQDTVNRMASGTTDITVFQPTVEAGYRFGDHKHWSFTPALALGYEINVKTDGEDVGEGAILLGGLSVTYRF